MMQDGPLDKRQEFFRGWYERGLPYDQYLASGSPVHQSRWQEFEKRLEMTGAQTTLLNSFKRTMHVLVLSGTWCGDCARQGPMLKLIEKAAPVMKFRYLDNQTYPEIRDELRIQGGTRVPVVVTLSEDFFEVGRFGDRTLSAYRRKASKELGDACDSGIVPGGSEELNLELTEWIDHFEREQLILRLSPFLRKRYGD